ncbi:hypothetical protein WG66_010247 [Moniliophthora roreri]|nr:hypothetical protein WG66_010247 [Moniliophthora roreri]
MRGLDRFQVLVTIRTCWYHIFTVSFHDTMVDFCDRDTVQLRVKNIGRSQNTSGGSRSRRDRYTKSGTNSRASDVGVWWRRKRQFGRFFFRATERFTKSYPLRRSGREGKDVEKGIVAFDCDEKG